MFGFGKKKPEKKPSPTTSASSSSHSGGAEKGTASPSVPRAGPSGLNATGAASSSSVAAGHQPQLDDEHRRRQFVENVALELTYLKTDLELFYWAVSEDDSDGVSFFLAAKQGTPLCITMPQVEAALFLAAHSNAGDSISLLLALPNSPGVSVIDAGTGWSLAFTAARAAADRAFVVLTSKGADTRFKDREGWTVFDAACYGGSVEIVTALLQSTPVESLDNPTLTKAIGIAAQEGHFELLNLFVPSPNFRRVVNDRFGDRPTPLFLACSRGFDKVVELLMLNGADPTICGPLLRTPLHVAVLSLSARCCEHLLATRRPNVEALDQADRTPLYYAQYCLPVAEMLFLHDARPLASSQLSDPAIELAMIQAYFTARLKIFARDSARDVATPLLLPQCDLENIPPEIAQDCLQVQNLLMPRNKIKTTIGVGLLVNLVTLDLSNNKLTSVGAEIGKLVKLRALDVSRNLLTELPLEIGLCVSLERLIVNNNRLAIMPESIGQLFRTLTYLDVSSNQLNDFPFQLTLLDGRLEFKWDSNPLKNLPKELLSQGTVGIINYLRQLMKSSSHCYQAKVLVVGKECVGKTNLIQALRNTSPKIGMITSSGAAMQVDESTPVATDGIEIQHWVELGTKEDGTKTEVTLSFWDFAGQEVYYTTHQLFLSPRSVYLLAFHAMEHEFDRTEYWLRAIYSRIQDPVIYLVATHLDLKACTNQHRETLTHTLMTRFVNNPAYPGIRGIVFVSSKTKRNIDSLRSQIVDSAMKLPQMGTLIPGSYLTFERELAVARLIRSPPLATWAEMVAMGSKCGIDEEGLKTAVQLYHDLGNVVCFAESESERLRNVIILDPRFIVLSLATIVSLKATMVKKGLLARKDWGFIWRPPLYPPEMHETLVEILHSFDVLFELPKFIQVEETDFSSQAPKSRRSKKATRDRKESKTPKDSSKSSRRSGGKTSSKTTKPPTSVSSTSLSSSSSLSSSLATAASSSAAASSSSYAASSSSPAPLEPVTTSFSRSMSTTGTRFETSVIPGLLPVDRPTKWETSWNQFRRMGTVGNFPQSGTPLVVGRNLTFHFIPSGFFSRLMVRLITLWDCGAFREELLWANGIVLQSHRCQAFIEYFPSESRIEVFLSGRELVFFLRLVLEQVEQLVVESFSGHSREYTKQAICPHCIAQLSSSEPFLFNIPECIQALSEKTPFLLCQQWRPVAVDDIVPDLALNDVPRIDGSKIEKLDCIGRGGFGEVWKAKLIESGQLVAMKTLLKNAGDPEQQFAAFCKEVVFMARLDHPNIVGLLYVSLDPTIALMTEFVTGGDLYHFVQSARNENRPIDPVFIWRTASDVAAGMKYLHGHFPPIIHRDLKSPNVLLASHDPNHPGVLAKVADFGIAGSVLSHAQKGGGDEFSYWQPPEILNQLSYSLPADVYSFAVLLSELLTANQPFSGLLDAYNTFFKIRRAITGGLRPSLPDSLVPEFRSLVERCWDGDAANRPSFAEICEELQEIYAPFVGKQRDAKSPKVGASSSARSAASSSAVSTPRYQPADLAPVVVHPLRSVDPPSKLGVLTCSVVFNNVAYFGTMSGKLLVVDQTSSPSVISAHATPVTSLSVIGEPARIWSVCAAGSICITEPATKKAKKLKVDNMSRNTSCRSTFVTTTQGIMVTKGKMVMIFNSAGLLLETVDLHLTDIDTRLLFVSPSSGPSRDETAFCHPLLPTGLSNNNLGITCSLVAEGDCVWLGCTSGMILRFDAQTRRILSRWQAHSDCVTAMISIAGQVWTAGYDGRVQLFLRRSGRFLQSVEIAEDTPVHELLTAGAFVCGLSKHRVYLWNRWSRNFVLTIPFAMSPITGAYLPSTNRLYLGSLDAPLSVFQVQSETTITRAPNATGCPRDPVRTGCFIGDPFFAMDSSMYAQSESKTVASYSSSSPLAHGITFSTLQDNQPSADEFGCQVWPTGALFGILDGVQSKTSAKHFQPIFADLLTSLRTGESQPSSAIAETLVRCLSKITSTTLSGALGVLSSESNTVVLAVSGTVKVYLRSAGLGRVFSLSQGPLSGSGFEIVTASVNNGDLVFAVTDGIWKNFNFTAHVDRERFEEAALSELMEDSVRLSPENQCDVLTQFTRDITYQARLGARRGRSLVSLDHSTVVSVKAVAPKTPK